LHPTFVTTPEEAESYTIFSAPRKGFFADARFFAMPESDGIRFMPRHHCHG